MFTGIIEWLGTVRELRDVAEYRALRIAAPTELCAQLSPGDSIAVDGVCLTVVDRTRDAFEVHVVPETLRRTTIGSWTPGWTVNLELPLAMGQRLGGHWVQGHIDGTTPLLQIEELGETCQHTYELPEAWRPYVVEKGSIALNGVSLTVADRTERTFSVALIPYTLEKTNLSRLRPGDRVNVEVDVLAKYIYHLVEPYLKQFPSG